MLKATALLGSALGLMYVWLAVKIAAGNWARVM